MSTYAYVQLESAEGTQFAPGLGLPTLFGKRSVLVIVETQLQQIEAAATTAGVPFTVAYGTAKYQAPAMSTGLLPYSSVAYDPVLLAKQYSRERIDARARFPLYTESGASLAVTGTFDATLTKSYSYDTTGQTNSTIIVADPVKCAALPLDLGTPGFQKAVFRNGANTAGFLYTSPSKDPNVIPANPNQNNLAIGDYRFRTNAIKVQVALYRQLGQVQTGHSVFVNGLPFTARPVAGAASADFVTLVFPDSAWRDIEVRTSCGFGPIFINPIYDVAKPDTRAALSVYCIGDSYSAAVVWGDTGAAAALQEESLAAGMEDFIGYSDNYIDGVAGTGWTIRTAGGLQGPNNNYQDRWVQVLRANPDVLFVPNGAANDCFNVVDPNTITAAVLSCFTQLRAQNSKTKFVWADGCLPPLTGFPANAARYIALRNLLVPALSAIGVYYIDTTTNPWMTGTGYIPAHANASGNSDWVVGNDQTHCTAMGYRYLRSRLGQKLRRIINDDGSLLNTVI